MCDIYLIIRIYILQLVIEKSYVINLLIRIKITIKYASGSYKR